MVSLSELFTFVLYMSKKYNIDTSHSEIHSMDVLNYANSIYEFELEKNPYLLGQKNIIYYSSVLHDMCDKKYMDTTQGINEINTYFKDKMEPNDLHVTEEIIKTMSYSYVKKYGFPNLGNYQKAYHIVREADLLSSYDFDRSIIYHMNRGNSFFNSYENALELFDKRIFKYKSDNLFLSDYSINLSNRLNAKAVARIKSWKRIIL
jgi:hypothetical protein